MKWIENYESGLDAVFKIDDILLQKESAYQEIVIAKTVAFGKGLFLDETSQSFAYDEKVYHSALVHPAMFSHANPKRVLIAGGGEGATLREVLKHPSVERAVMVDLDREVVDACREYLPEWSDGAYDDPRTELVIEDINTYLTRQPDGSFDVIVADLGDPVTDGPSMVGFTQDFYREIDRVLAPGGVFVTQAGEMEYEQLLSYRGVLWTMQSVFAHTHPYRVSVSSFLVDWGMIMASREPIAPQNLEARWRAAGGESWEEYDPAGHQALLWMSPRVHRILKQPAEIIIKPEPLRVWEEMTALVSDDAPIP